MKKYIYLISFVIVFAVTTGCFDDPGTDITLSEQFISLESDSYTFVENQGIQQIQISVSQGAPSDVQINYTIGGDAVQGADFNILSPNPIIIPAGEYSTVIEYELIDNDFPEVATRSFTLDLTANSASIDINPIASTKVTITNEDCDIPSLVGAFTVVNTNANPGGCNDVSYDATVTLVSDDGNGKFTYEVTDITGGLYAICYDEAPNPGQFTTDVFEIAVTSVPDVVYGGDEFNGSGKIECDGSFLISWSNGYGDAATSTYTPK